MSKRPDDRTPLAGAEESAAANDTSPRDELDSEPRRKWRPNPQLIRALAATQKDLRPGEAALFWDWTATRDSAPEAEDVRPSGEGEVLVSDKDAAAAYVPPKEVSPPVAPRPSTRSRIRVREDLDPRRQPTVKSARDSTPRVTGHLPEPAAREEPRPESVRCPSLAQERRRRVAWAIPVSIVTAVIVFLWLRLPDPQIEPGRGDARTAVAPATPRPPSRVGTQVVPGRTSAPGAASSKPRADVADLRDAGARAAHGTAGAPATPAAAPPVTGSTPKTAKSAAPKLEPPRPAPPPPGGTELFIRKKGDSAP